MPLVDVNFARQVATSSAPQNSREKLINMHAEVETGGRSPLLIRQRPGLSTKLAATGEKRCNELHKTDTYAVIDNELRKYDGSTETVLGTLATNSGRCSMVFDDNDNILVADQLNAYHYNGTTLSTVTTPTDVGTIASLSGYGIYSSVNSGQFYVSAANDFTSWSALDFATAESSPDNLVRVFADHNELWLFGSRSIEIWQLSGTATFAFARFTNAQIERGTAAAFSVCAEENTVFWLGDDHIVYRADGYRPTAISNPSVTRLIEALSSSAIKNADAFIYTIEGEKFYTIRFPDELTIQINLKTGAWNTATTYDYDDWRVLGSAGKGQKYLLTDAGYSELSYAVNQDDGGIIERIGVSSPIAAGGNRFSAREFFLDVEVGRAPAGVSPQISMRAARDSESFGNERWRTFGSIGQYKARPVWRNLGIARDLTLEFKVTDNCSFKVMGAKARIEAGNG